MNFLPDALMDTAKLVPFLLTAYVLVGFLEHHDGERMGSHVTRLGRGGPLLGALLGCIPQCGFSVLTAALYTKRMTSPGTLLSVFLATSDEAIPILLAHPNRARIIVPLILLKLVIAVPAGILYDALFWRPSQDVGLAPGSMAARDEALHHAACCVHEVSTRPSLLQALVKHPLLHTLKISGYLLVVSAGLNLLMDQLGKALLGSLFLKGSLLQPVLASLLGLIPNCFASVALTEFYMKGSLSFGSWVGGLCAGAALGSIVLIRENGSWKNTLLILSVMFCTSVAWGMLLQASLLWAAAIATLAWVAAAWTFALPRLKSVRGSKATMPWRHPREST